MTMLTIRDGHGELREDLDEAELLNAIRVEDSDLVGGSLNELVLERADGTGTRLIFHHSSDGRYMVTHVDASGQGHTAIADGDPHETVRIGIAGDWEEWPGDHFVKPWIAVALAECFLVNFGRDRSVEWRASSAHR